ncbi:MAG: Tm-1-like ATP-binding domain-containing protein [Desulfomonile sp.]
MPNNVVIIGTLDTKGQEVEFLRESIIGHQCVPIVLDVGILNPPTTVADILRERVALAGGSNLEELLRRKDRRLAVQTMIRGAAELLRGLNKQEELSGIIAIGGGTGTHIGMGVMRTLPLGLPKLMVSTVASRDMSNLIGTKDITVMHSVVDILGLNAVSKKILSNAAAAIAGMAKQGGKISSDKPIIGLTSFGFITQGAMRVKTMLEGLGYEVAPFHANGTGGMAMEDLIDQGLISGVMDLALHEFADALYGGYCGDIGPGRLESAGRMGLPQLVVPGGLDCIVLEFNSVETMPPDLRDRKVFWYDFRSGVRTNREDMARLAATISGKLNRANGPTRVMIPMKGFSEADAIGAPLYEPITNQAFLSALKSGLNPEIEVIEVNAHINDAEFAEAAVSTLNSMMRETVSRSRNIDS